MDEQDDRDDCKVETVFAERCCDNALGCVVEDDMDPLDTSEMKEEESESDEEVIEGTACIVMDFAIDTDKEVDCGNDDIEDVVEESSDTSESVSEVLEVEMLGERFRLDTPFKDNPSALVMMSEPPPLIVEAAL
jgi:hypothetical protein